MGLDGCGISCALVYVDFLAVMFYCLDHCGCPHAHGHVSGVGTAMKLAPWHTPGVGNGPGQYLLHVLHTRGLVKGVACDAGLPRLFAAPGAHFSLS